jgi:flavin-dependent dehydrogenase
MVMVSVPNKTKILVIGGGPGGSTAATLLARQGFEVTLFEKAHFPRYHIGESLLPTILPILDLLGAREKIEAFGFQKKMGAFLQWGEEEWPLNFGELAGNLTYSFQVTRAEFDHLLLDHARSMGVQVYEGVEVKGINFEGERPISARWIMDSKNGNKTGSQGEISFDFLIDASGRTSLMSNRYLRNRRYHKIFQNIAIWGYWKNANRLATGREGDIAVNSIPNGWLWGIPLHDDIMSVGVVMHKDYLASKKSFTQEEIYMQSIDEGETIKNIVKDAELVSSIYTETDYSYASERFCGPGYFLVGDAACFLDPLLSSGVHLATFSALLAAASLTSILCNEISEEQGSSFFEKSYRQAYLRFLVFLSAFYDVGRTKESYFWEAQRLTEDDVEAGDLKMAFLKLVTGVKDINDASRQNAHSFVLTEMTKRIDENLKFRRDKMALANVKGKDKQAVDDNARFFSSVEGLFSLDAADAVDGFYIATTPRLGLTRIQPENIQ